MILHDSLDINLVSQILTTSNINIIKFGKYNSLLHPLSEFKNEKPIYASNIQKSLLNPYLLPVIISWSDDEYTGIEYNFYNKPRKNKVDFHYFYKLISNALPPNILHQMNQNRIKNIKQLDNFIISNQIVEKLLNNEICRSSQNFSSWLSAEQK